MRAGVLSCVTHAGRPRAAQRRVRNPPRAARVRSRPRLSRRRIDGPIAPRAPTSDSGGRVLPDVQRAAGARRIERAHVRGTHRAARAAIAVLLGKRLARDRHRGNASPPASGISCASTFARLPRGVEVLRRTLTADARSFRTGGDTRSTAFGWSTREANRCPGHGASLCAACRGAAVRCRDERRRTMARWTAAREGRRIRDQAALMASGPRPGRASIASVMPRREPSPRLAGASRYVGPGTRAS